jgi:two-component system cell cycle response regulator DivK
VAGPLVLVVDDNSRNLKLARDVLLAAGFQTLEAATAGEAIALAEEHLPDVILMDIRLPDMDGTEAARRLAEGRRTSGIPVVALTSLALEEVACFAGYLAKPIDVQAFPEQVRGYCRAAEDCA